MTDYFTKIPGAPSSSEAKPGMAFFAHTGPAGSRCGLCKHRGYLRESSRGHWSETGGGSIVFNSYRHQGCAIFKKLTGQHGPSVDQEWAGCKYFEAKPK